jgi:hypothetical protein
MSWPDGSPGIRRLNPRKQLLSKWTAAQPHNRERHFLVTELQAVLTQRSQQLDWRQLQDSERWRQDWH